MYVEGLPYDVIKTDNIEAGCLATEHLLALGHRRIGIIVGIPGLATSDDRYAGYIRAFADRGLSPDRALVLSGEFDRDAARAAALKLLSATPRPTAIVAISNMMTVGLLFAIRELGLRSPEDISVVGVDDLDFAELLEPNPTVVVTPILAMARRSIQKLLDQLSRGQVGGGKWEIFQPSLLVRHSTASVEDA
jgi:LacI family transcriptional regulator